MKLAMKIIIVVLCAVLLCVGVYYMIYNTYCKFLTDDGIDGFVGMEGIKRLQKSGDLYTKLTDDPLQILVECSRWEEFLTEYFDSVDMVYFSSYGEINGVRYKFQSRAFTSAYQIWTIKECPLSDE